MSDREFLNEVERTLSAIETAIEATGAEIELSRSENVLTLEFENGSKIVINSQLPMHELWVAARAGGFHYRYALGRWSNTRDASELFAALTQLVSNEAGLPVPLTG